MWYQLCNQHFESKQKSKIIDIYQNAIIFLAIFQKEIGVEKERIWKWTLKTRRKDSTL